MSAKANLTALAQLFGPALIGGVAGIAGIAGVAASTKGGDAPAGAKAVRAPAPPAAVNGNPDDLIARARIAERRVIDIDKEIVALLMEVNKRLAAMDRGDVNKEKMTLEAFAKLLPALKAQARDLMDKRVELEALGHRLLGALSSSHTSLTDMVPLWQRYAAEEADPGLRDNYAATAKSIEGFAAEMKRRGAEFEKDADVLKLKLAVIERSHVFLERIEKVLPILNNPLADGKEVQVYMKQVRQYLENFEAAVRFFREIEQKMQRHADPKAGGKAEASNDGKKPGDKAD